MGIVQFRLVDKNGNEVARGSNKELRDRGFISKSKNLYSYYAKKCLLKRKYKIEKLPEKYFKSKSEQKKRAVVLAKYSIVSKELAKSIDNKEEFIKVQTFYDNPKINPKTRTELNRVRNSIEAYLMTRKEIKFRRVKDKQKIIGYEIRFKNK